MVRSHSNGGNILATSLVTITYQPAYLLTLPSACTAHLAIVVLYDFLTSPWTERNRTKSWRRVIGDSAFRLLLASFNVRQLQRYVGPSVGQYIAWARKEHVLPVIEDLGQDTQLLWLGPKKTNRVILCCHGCNYSCLIPFLFMLISFFLYRRRFCDPNGRLLP